MTVFEFWGMWNIIGKIGDQNKIINYVWFIIVETNHNRLIIDKLIAKKQRLSVLRHGVYVQFHNTCAISTEWKFVEHVFRKTGFIILQECAHDL